jgi:hypothetical protein
VHEAARIAAHADSSRILVSEATAASAGATTTTPVQRVAFKGLNNRLAVQEILWAATAAKG